MSSLYFYVFKGDKPHNIIIHTKHSILNLICINDLVWLEPILFSIFAFLYHPLGADFKSGNLNANHYDQSEDTF